MSQLGAERIQRVELHYPRYGTAWARVSTVANAVPVGPATLTVGDLVLAGAVLPDRNGENSPSSWTGIWVNGAGWDTVLPPRAPYQNDDGVRLKTVITHLAIDCGVSVTLPTDAPMSTHWCRTMRAGNLAPRTGRDELAVLVRRSYIPTWYVDPAGVTRFTPRSSGSVMATTRILDRDLTRGRRLVGLESPAAFVPGGTFEGATIERVVICESAGKLTLETWES